MTDRDPEMLRQPSRVIMGIKITASHFWFATLFMIIALAGFSNAAADPGFLFKGTMAHLTGELAPFSEKPFEVSYRFNKRARDAKSSDPQSGFYPGAIKSGQLVIQTSNGPSVWDIDATGPHNYILIQNSRTAAAYYAEASLVPNSDRFNPTFLVIRLADRRGIAFSNDSLPLMLALDVFDSTRSLQLTNPRLSFYGTVASVQAIGEMSDPAEAYAEMLEAFVAVLKELRLVRNIETSLTSKLEAAAVALRLGNQDAASAGLGAFGNEVEAQRGKQIPEATSVALLHWRDSLQQALEITESLRESKQPGPSSRLPFRFTR